MQFINNLQILDNLNTYLYWSIIYILISISRYLNLNIFSFTFITYILSFLPYFYYFSFKNIQSKL